MPVYKQATYADETITLQNNRMRWMLDHKIENWLPHNLPWTLELFREGKMDLCFADTHNTTTGNYGGAGIMPDAVAVKILYLLAEDKG